MINKRKRSLWVLFVCFLTVFLAFGSGYMAVAVFFNPLLRTFGWSRAKLSSLTMLMNLAIAGGSLVVGWLMDRLPGQAVIATGVAAVGGGFILASAGHTYMVMALAYLIIGLGLAASTVVPCTVVVANWFDAHRGTALAVTASGWALGGMAMNMVCNRLIAHFGWRTSYIALAAPLFIILIPLVLVIIRTRPGDALEPGVKPKPLSGLNLREAFTSRSFWMIIVGECFYGFAANGCNLHTIPYLLTIGYRAEDAALVWSTVLGIAGIVKILLGMLADRVTGRAVLSSDLFFYALGLVFLLYARQFSFLVVYIAIVGATIGTPAALFPMVIVESLGLKRYGTLSGFGNWANTVGGALGMVIAGWIFDIFGTYKPSFGLFSFLLLLAAGATYLVRTSYTMQGELAGAGQAEKTLLGTADL